MKFHNKETYVGDKFNDDTYEYRTFTLCKEDYDKLPLYYRAYYLADNKARIKTQNAYLDEQDRLLTQAEEQAHQAPSLISSFFSSIEE